MLFNSYEFIFLFLPITFLIYFYLNHKKLTIASKIFLVSSSLFFYSWWNIIYLPLILSSMIINFFIGVAISKVVKSAKKANKLYVLNKKILLGIGILFNISLIGYFKYSNFFIENFNIATSSNIGLLNLTLPLAISFFTFQQVAYLVDSYRSDIEEYSFLNYSLFVTFFPQLIAGPIVHHKEMMPQFENMKNTIINHKNIALALFIFSIGLFKKVVIADTFAKWANIGFDSQAILSLVEAWTTSLSYTFQLYFDFSGYSDMAIGLALFFNIKLPINFNSPYKAINIQEFWKRWHITLSRFLKDYIYIPLGGNRKGDLKLYTNLMTTFILGGIWHGAGWTFIFWGFLHGMALVVYKLWDKLSFKLWTWLSWLITFNFINIAWVFFRAKEWEDGIRILRGMIGLEGVKLPSPLSEKLAFLEKYGVEFGAWVANVDSGDGGKSLIFFLIIGFVLILCFKNSNEKLISFKLNYETMIYSVSIFIVALLFINRVSEFLYFNF